MIKTFLDGLLLPVNPFDDITLQAQGSNQRVEIVKLGEVTLFGSRKLYGLTIKSLFTDNVYPWSVSASPKPADYYVAYLERLWARQAEQKQPTRIVIVGDGIDINMPCSIEGFTQSRSHGETNEIYYTLSLLEYRSYSITRLDSVPDELKRPKVKKSIVKSDVKPVGRTYTVKNGDCLSSIAQSCYGDGNVYKKIYTANQSMMDAYNNKHGMPKYTIYSGWVLAIP